MKFINDTASQMIPVLELTRRNLEALLAKLDDPLSERALVAPTRDIAVRAVENDEHYSNRFPGEVYMPTIENSY